MNRSKPSSIAFWAATVCAACLVLVVAADPAHAQRSVVEDTSTVKVSKRAPKTITRGPTRIATAQQASNGVLVVLTDPPAATISVDGKVLGTSDANGEFTRELRAGAHTVKVSAGAEYTPMTERIALGSKKTEILRAPLVSINAGKFGLVKIGPLLDDAKIYVDDNPTPWTNITIDKQEGLMLVDGLTPGKHKLRLDHPDYIIVEKTFAKISGGEEYYWVFKPIPATVPMTVNTESKTKIYVDGEFVGETPANGSLEVPEVKLGTHEVKLVKDGYVEFKETHEFAYGKPVSVGTKLVPLPTSAEFSDDFDINLTKWAAVPGLSLKSGRLFVANAESLCIAKEINYRDFVMAFHLRLEDGAGAAWAVRAKDPNSYYLFYLSGPKGMFPNRFSTYIVTDGKFDPTNPVQSVPVITNLAAKGEYQIEIHGAKDVIEHTITPAATGKPEPLGVFQDKDSTYLYGGIGFRSVGAEQFSIDELYVQPRQ